MLQTAAISCEASLSFNQWALARCPFLLTKSVFATNHFLQYPITPLLSTLYSIQPPFPPNKTLARSSGPSLTPEHDCHSPHTIPQHTILCRTIPSHNIPYYTITNHTIPKLPLTVDSSPVVSTSSSAASKESTFRTAPSSLGLRAWDPHSLASS